MRLVTAFTIAATIAFIPVSGASAFGEPNTWSSGWGQGVSEYIAVNHNGDELYIACSNMSPVSMTLIANGKSYGGGEQEDFSLTIDGTTIQHPYETSSRVDADNFLYAWDLLRKANSIQAVTSDGAKIELPSQGSARALPAWGTPEFSCHTEFYGF